MKLYEIPNALRKALDDVYYNDETKTAAGLEEYQEVENDAKDKLENTPSICANWSTKQTR